MEQKIVLSPAELASMVGQKKDEEKPHIAQANKDDYVRLAQLKIEKQFEPKIQALSNKVEKLKKELDVNSGQSAITEAAREQIRASEKKAVDNAVAAIKAMNKAGKDVTDKLESFVGKRLPEFVAQMDEAVMVNVTTANLSEIIGTVTVAKSYTRAVRLDAGEKVRNLIKDRNAKLASIAKAEEDLEIMNKCKTKASKAVLGEVEESLLTHMIGKVAETKEIQEDINARVEEALNSRLLTAGDED